MTATGIMKTQMANAVDQRIMGANATVIDFWGENNPKYHMTVTLNNPEDQFRDSREDGRGYAGLRDQGSSYANKLYCSIFSNAGTLAWGEELHFNTVYSFSIQEDFVNPDREPDRWVGLPK